VTFLKIRSNAEENTERRSVGRNPTEESFIRGWRT
jgi:hypothetical protein